MKEYQEKEVTDLKKQYEDFMQNITELQEKVKVLLKAKPLKSN